MAGLPRFFATLKFSIGHRLFASVLLAILAVAAGAVFLLRQNVLASFGDYAVGIELDRLDELTAALARQYRSHGGWTFIPGDGRQGWIARELERLQRVRDGGMPVPAAPAPPPAPARGARRSGRCASRCGRRIRRSGRGRAAGAACTAGTTGAAAPARAAHTRRRYR